MKTKSKSVIAILSVLATLTLLACLQSQTAFAAKGGEYWLGYRMPDEEWINGNLSPHKDYAECDWVPYQLIITTASKVWKDPEFGFINGGSADIGWTFWAGSKWDAIYVDMLGSFYYKFDTDPLPDGDPGSLIPYELEFDELGHPGWMSFTPAILNRPGEISKTTGLYEEVPETCEYPEHDHFIRLTPGEGSFPSADEFASGGYSNIVVYFKAHLALDILWKNGQEAQLPTDLAGTLYQDFNWTCPHRGSSHYQGSASHFFLQFKGLGAKTIPIPIAAYPEGIIQGHKYVDVNGNGIYDNGDYPYTEGWGIDATATIYPRPSTAITFSLEHLTTDETGFYQYTGLVEGIYAIDEEEKADWIHTGHWTDAPEAEPWDPINGIVTINFARGQTATVDFLNVYYVDLDVSKDVTVFWEQTLTWTIEKTATPEVSEIFVFDMTDVLYTITVTADVESNIYEVSGTITIFNPNPPIVDVYATILDEVWCGGVLKGSQDLTPVGPIPSGTSTYDYSIELFDVVPDEYINRVTVEVTSPVDRTYTAEEPFWFTEPTDYVDDNVIVYDDIQGDLGTVHFSESPKTFDPYIETFGPYDAVGVYEIDNTATATGEDSDRVWEDSETVEIRVYDITPSKDAYTWWERVFDWTITKEVESAQPMPFINDQIEVKYTIDVMKFVDEDTFMVSGWITIVNNNPAKPAEVHVYDKVVEVPGTEIDLGAWVVAYGDPLVLYYEITFEAEDGVLYTNEVQVYLNNYHWDYMGMATEFLGTTEFTDSQTFTYIEPDVKIHDWVTVTDVQVVPAGLDLVSSDYPLGGWLTNASDTFYVNKVVEAQELGTWVLRDEAFAEGDESMTWSTGEKTLTFDVYDIDPSKNAEPWWEREFDWTIDKSVEPTELTFLKGESGEVTYTITITKFAVRDEFKVNGTITIVNNNPEKTAEVHVYDKVKVGDDIVPGTLLDLGAWTIPPEGTLYLEYEITFEAEDGVLYTNEVQVYLNNYRWNLDLSRVFLDTTEFTATADFTFDEPTSLVDDSATVEEYEDVPPEFSASVDYGPHGMPPWTVTDSNIISFTKNITEVSAEACVWYRLPNTVTLTEIDTLTVYEASAEVRIHIPFTATVGYWKNHRDEWVDLDPDALFPRTDYTYMDVLWMSAASGDASVILAQQYIAAVLNMHAFGVPTYIEGAIIEAEAYLADWPPGSDPPNAEGPRADMIHLADLLEDYNSHGPHPP